MSFHLKIEQINTLEAIITGMEATESKVKWLPYYITQNSSGSTISYVNDALSGTYVKTGDSVVWGQFSANSDIISITGLNDNILVYLSAIDGAGNVSDDKYFAPYHLKTSIINKTPLNASFSCYYEQTFTNQIKPIDEDVVVKWNFVPQFNYISGGLGDESITIPVTNGLISGFAITAAKISYEYKRNEQDQQAYVIVDVDDKYRLSDLSSSIFFSEASESIIFNPSITPYVHEQSTDYIILCAIQTNEIIPNTTIINWNATPTNNLSGLTGIFLNEPYQFLKNGSGEELKIIKLKTDNLSENYTYRISAYTGEVSGNFRPYKGLIPSSILNTNVQFLGMEDNVYVYYVHCYGLTNNIKHNLHPHQYILWNTVETNVLANYFEDSTYYNFGAVGTAENIDRLYIKIEAPVVTNVPQLCTATFQVYALSTSQISEGYVNTHTFTIDYLEQVDKSYFYPEFQFQYESPSLSNIYRPISSGFYRITNTSKLPPNSYGQIIYTFNDAICTLPYDCIIHGPGGGVSPILHYFDLATNTNTICTISMAVCAFGPEWNDPFIKTASDKQIFFIQIPDASKVVVYPEFQWHNNEWCQNVLSESTGEGYLLSADAPLSAYGMCHIENFFLSTNQNAEFYNWTIQSINNPQERTYHTISTAPTAWIAVKTSNHSENMCICAIMYMSAADVNMPMFYYDNPEGSKFNNFASTFEFNITSEHFKHIKIVGPEEIGIESKISKVSHNKLPVPNNLSITGDYIGDINNTPFDLNVIGFYFKLSSEFWDENINGSLSNNKGFKTVPIRVDDIGDSFLGVPKAEKTKISISPGINYILNLKTPHPSAAREQWCLQPDSIVNINNNIIITAYPIDPLLYTPNKFMLTGSFVLFENLVQCFEDVKEIEWTDRNSKISYDTCQPYITNYDVVGDYNISFNTKYNYFENPAENPKISSNIFKNIINIQEKYMQYDSNLTRVYGQTTLNLPYNKQDCTMPPNEWTVKDTFNGVINKFYNNLLYLDNMSKMYDSPPSEYIGWYGSLYYNNSAKRTRWFTKTPHNSYKYNLPNTAIDYIFDDLQSCYVRNNIMYISNGTNVFILSGDAKGTVLGNLNFKSVGDDFTCVRSIDLDNENRIYILDSYNDNIAGSKNRIIVYNFNMDTHQWTILYEWGGLGGPNAKTKFNNPSDLHLDNENTIWVADTLNKCVKRFTRTGNWLYTIKLDINPLSITTQNNYVYILTNNTIIKYDKQYNYIDAFNIESGAKKIQSGQDGGFVYVTYKDKISKIMVNGTLAGNIANNDFNNYVENYRDSFHDEYRNLYIVSKNHILKYVDLLSIVSIKQDILSQMWPLSACQVHKDEYIQDWVINKCLHRMWDNFELYRRSLNGKFAYKRMKTVTTTNVTTSLKMPDDFDVCAADWLYDHNKLITVNQITEYDKPVVRTFTPFEYKELPYNKTEIYIGINELNSADVYNRVFGKLFECQETLLKMIDD